jgi:acetyltransferase-like isoleucine patch superfamily enzyme
MELIGKMKDLKLKKLSKIFFYAYRIVRDYIYCKSKIGNWDFSWRFHGLPIIQKCKNSQISIGKNFVACSNSKNNSIGIHQKVIIKTVKADSKIIIGNNVGISGCTISSSISIKIGNDTFIGSGVLITDSDAHSIHPG